jgi:hypothetical protein
MVAATAHPNPVALLPWTDLQGASATLEEAQKWLEHIRTVESSTERMLNGGEGVDREKWENVLPSLQFARKYAEEHVEILAKRDAARKARRSRGD